METTRRGVALGGFMGVGKTTVGRRLADRLGLPFVDTDSVLAARHGPIAQQFEAAGEAVFRERERALVAELCDGAPAVVATGGGTWVDPSSRGRLRARFHTVVLRAPLDVIRGRGVAEGRPLWGDAERLLAERALAYEDADRVVDADRPVDEIVDEIATGLASAGTRVHVALGERSYAVEIEAGGLDGLGERIRERLPAKRAFLVTDTNVAPLWAQPAEASLERAGFEVARIVLPAGEIHKTLATWSTCVDALLAGRIDRGTPVVALGGGVVGDVAGFAAATVLRGVPFVQVPTTLLAMVDSSVGGKTAVDHPSGKNLVGAFHQPQLVVAALATLGTLSRRELRAGLGEVVKTALLGDPGLFERLEADAERLADGDVAALLPVVTRCVEIKAAIVAADEREGGPRMVLNLGHTVGHALEAALGFHALLHGEAVAIGLVAETRWAARRGWCEDPQLHERLARLLARMGLPYEAPKAPLDAVLAALGVDKKRGEGNLRVPVPVRVGQVIAVELPLDSLSDLLMDLG